MMEINKEQRDMAEAVAQCKKMKEQELRWLTETKHLLTESGAWLPVIAKAVHNLCVVDRNCAHLFVDIVYDLLSVIEKDDQSSRLLDYENMSFHDQQIAKMIRDNEERLATCDSDDEKDELRQQMASYEFSIADHSVAIQYFEQAATAEQIVACKDKIEALYALTMELLDSSLEKTKKALGNFISLKALCEEIKSN